MESKVLAENICKILSDKKAQDIVKIYVAEKTVLADYFIIAGGRSQTQVRALSDYVDEGMSKLGVEVKRREGETEGRWAVLDFGDCIVHIFNDESRLFYHLEKLWGDESNIEKIKSEDKAISCISIHPGISATNILNPNKTAFSKLFAGGGNLFLKIMYLHI